MVAGGRPRSEAVQRRRTDQHPQLRALRAGQRCKSAGGRVQAPRASHRLYVDRAHYGQLPRDCRGAGISACGAQLVRQARRGAAHRRGQDGLSRRARRRAGTIRNQGRPLHLHQGAWQRLSHLRAGRARGHHAQDWARRRARRHLYGAFDLAGGGGEDLANSGRNRCAGTDRGLWHAPALREGQRGRCAGHRSQLRGSSVHERAVLRSRTAAQLSRLEGQRLLVLRRHGAGAARRRCAVRARLSRTLVRVRGARCVLPRRYLEGLRDRGGRHPEVERRHAQSAGLSGAGARTREEPDAIIVGAGHNGLVAACYLARSGLKVLVLERQPYIGGAAVSRRLYEDFTYSNCSYVCSLLRPEIIRSLELPQHAPQVIPYEGGCTMMQDGGHLALYDNHDALRREIARHSRRDAEAYDRYSRDVMRQCKFIKPLLMREPPDPTSFKPRDLQELLYLGRRFHGLGEERMYDTLRFWTMSAADFLDEYFESEIVKAHFAGSSIIGTALGPRSPGTAYVLLHHYMGDIDDTVGAWGFARGGMGAISKALGASFEASGGTIRAAAPVSQVLVKGGRATGV